MRDSIESVRVGSSRNKLWLPEKKVVELCGLWRRRYEDLRDGGLIDPMTIVCHFTCLVKLTLRVSLYLSFSVN